MTAGAFSLAGAATRGDHAVEQQAALSRLLSPDAGEAGADGVIQALVDRFGDVGSAIVAPKDEVARLLGGEGAAAAERLADLHALVLAVVRRRAMARPILGSRVALKRYLLAALSGEKREQFRVLYLDSRNGLILEEVCGLGTRDHAPVYPREIIRRALELSASAMVLVHNHPSGDPTPSAQDIQTTAQIVAAGAVFSIAVHDHLVVGRGRVFSFHDSGLIGTEGNAGSAARPVRPRGSAVSRAGRAKPADPVSPSVHSA